MGREIRKLLAAAAGVISVAVAVMIIAPDNLIDVRLADFNAGFVALAMVPALGAADFGEVEYADAQLIGQVFTAEDIGDFLVCGTMRGLVHFYHVETCNLGRMEARQFNAAVRGGLIQWRSDLQELVACPLCGGHVELVTNGAVDGEPTPFVSCVRCAFAEEL